MSNLEDDFKTVRTTLASNTGYAHPARTALERIADAMQEASAIMIRARFVAHQNNIHDGSMEAGVVRDIDEWRKKQGLQR